MWPSSAATAPRQANSASVTTALAADTGIPPSPNQTTGGEGPKTGQEVRFHVTLATHFDLPTDHYFFVPQVELSDQAQHWSTCGAA